MGRQVGRGGLGLAARQVGGGRARGDVEDDVERHDHRPIAQVVRAFERDPQHVVLLRARRTTLDIAEPRVEGQCGRPAPFREEATDIRSLEIRVDGREAGQESRRDRVGFIIDEDVLIHPEPGRRGSVHRNGRTAWRSGERDFAGWCQTSLLARQQWVRSSARRV